MKKLSYWVVMMLCFLLSLSCDAGDASSEILPATTIKVGTAMYLEEVIPPCIDSGTSGVDPCVPEVPPEVEILSSSSSSLGWPQDNFPTWTEIILADGYFSSATHIIIRGVVNVDTTRCEAYPVKAADYVSNMITDPRLIDFLETGNFENGYLDYHCFVDINVKEYIIGTGPPNLTVSIHQETIWDTSINDWPNVKDWWELVLDEPQLRIASAYEGKELLLFLGTTFSTLLESWEVHAGIWFVQQTGNRVRAVAQNYRYAETEAQRSRLDVPLDELVEQIKKAAEERLVITEGRIGTELYFPLLVNDANYLKDYYTSVGAVYDDSEGATVLPPPAPGEGDLAAPTIPVNEGTTDTTLPVPGEETSVPPSTDDAGLVIGQETTTTTSSTTTVAEAPATSDTTPTVTTTAATAEEPVATAPDATETVTGTTTTTTSTTVATETNGEDVVPSVDDDSPGGEPATSTSTSSTLAQTTVVVAPSGDDDGSVEGSAVTLPSDGVAPPVDNGGPDGEQPDTVPPADDG